MALPPFPSQDLAKLVLGYLAEEQLMTAYDEFLQASPYLDAFRNEYDRIFMTSLRNILAEYRALKIFVETCKPYALRKRLFQCGNLVEVIKFLVKNVDVNKFSNDSQNIVNTIKPNICQACNTSCGSCSCKQNLSFRGLDTTVECSVEATPLSDLPGSHTKKVQNLQELSQQPSIHKQNQQVVNHIIITDHPNIQNAGHSNTPAYEITLRHTNTSPTVDTLPQPAVITTTGMLGNNVTPVQVVSNVPNVLAKSQNMSSSDSFRDFVRGVSSNSDRQPEIAPDSSTSDSIRVPVSSDNSCNNSNINRGNNKILPVNVMGKKFKTSSKVISFEEYNSQIVPQATKKSNDDSKVKILSDIKMELNNKLKIPANTSTPLLQTIYINGTPAFRTRPIADGKINFTKDEIMAMPTLILITTSGPPHIPMPPATTTMAKISEVVTTRSNASEPLSSLAPLTIDITSNDSPTASEPTVAVTEKKAISHGEIINNLVTTVEPSKFVSLPKDSSTNSSKTNTPQVLPTLRKASSTPRRVSHVRVLDFATPRRILQEAIDEESQIKTCDSNAEVIVSKSPNCTFLDTDTSQNTVINVTHCQTPNSSKVKSDPVKDNKNVKSVKSTKSSWDEDLRAVIDKPPEIESKPKRTRKKSVKQKESEAEQKGKKSHKEKKSSKNVEPEKRNVSQAKNSNSTKTKSNEIIEKTDQQTNDCAVKPTINIVQNTSRNTNNMPAPGLALEKDKPESKPVADQLDTPDIDERLSLQNAIGVKLNISDLLETPYKQALYDIQMETPRFLGPDLPGEPLSDIKIMNIPTPRFLTTPGSNLKGIQATPSSYSSRPTDYSSGSSYYKPDDQDYIPAPEILGNLPKIQINATTNKEDTTKSNKNNKVSKRRSLRPARKCTKNVSYFGSHKEEEKVDDDSSDADLLDSTTSKVESTSPVENTKSDNPVYKTRQSAPRKRKSTKKESPNFMKIKPKRSPFKDLSAKNKKVATPKSATRKRTSSKNANTPVISAPTKSRRKSSTPRKLTTKTINIVEEAKEIEPMDSEMKMQTLPQNRKSDSDTDQPPLRWPDDSSETKSVKDNLMNTSETETDDISKIQEYIKTTTLQPDGENSSSLHIDLVKRGFDIETAKSIERDLLDVSTHEMSFPPTNKTDDKNMKLSIEKSIESDTSASLQIVQEEQEDEVDEEDYEFSVHECNEDIDNYFVVEHDSVVANNSGEPFKLRDKYLMEVCIDDGAPIKLRATNFSLVLDQDPGENIQINKQETEQAISSISNMDKLYTPLKDADAIRAQCHEIFDSTLTSLDTPMKVEYRDQTTVTQIVLEIEPLNEKVEDDNTEAEGLHAKEVNEHSAPKKRKRQGSNDSQTSKKTRPEAQYLLNSANIQNIDIESVLSKLHGP